MGYKGSGFVKPDLDAGLGLIFRLNALWEKADRRALSGDLDGWELVLDRIYSNLLYREDLETEEDDEGNIISIELQNKDNQVHDLLKEKINEAKKNYKIGGMKKDILKINKSKVDHYHAIMMYDIWLRKFMRSLNLYLKEVESNPSRSLFGGAFNK